MASKDTIPNKPASAKVNPKENSKGKSKKSGAQKSGVAASKEPLNAKTKGNEKAIEDDENDGGSDSDASDEPTSPKGNSIPNPANMDPNTPEDADPLSPFHLKLRMKREDDEMAYKALLPYLANGFTTVTTSCSGDKRFTHDCGSKALQLSFDAAKKLVLNSKDDPTPLKDWLGYFKSPQYKNAAIDYARTVEKITDQSAIDVRVEALSERSKSGPLTMAQMSCLLRVANAKHDTHFQLGVIKSGYQGRYDIDTRALDLAYSKQSQLLIADKTLLTKPVVWVYNTNEEERKVAHQAWSEFSEESASHWEGFAKELKPSKIQRIRIQQLGVDGRVKNDVAAGLYLTLRNLKSNEVPCDIVTSLQTHNRDDEGAPSASVIGYAPNGKAFLFKHKTLRRITSEDGLLGDLLDDPPVEEVDYNTNPQPSGGPLGGRKRKNNSKRGDNVEGEWQIENEAENHNFFRVIEPTTRTGRIPGEKAREKINMGGFKPDNGEIVLDTGFRKTNSNMEASKVIRPNKVEGWIYSRRLQPLERAFGFTDHLPTLEPWVNLDPEKTTLEEARKFYNASYDSPMKDITNFVKKNTTIPRLNKREAAKRVGLTVSKLKKPVTAVGQRPGFEKGEYVLIDDELDNKKKYQVRDFEGREAAIDDKNLGDFIEYAWGFALSKDAFESGLHFTDEEPDKSTKAKKKSDEPTKVKRNPTKSTTKTKDAVAQAATTQPKKGEKPKLPPPESEEESDKPTKRKKNTAKSTTKTKNAVAQPAETQPKKGEKRKSPSEESDDELGGTGNDAGPASKKPKTDTTGKSGAGGKAGGGKTTGGKATTAKTAGGKTTGGKSTTGKATTAKTAGAKMKGDKAGKDRK